MTNPNVLGSSEDDKKPSLLRVFAEMFAMQTIRKDDLPMVREAMSAGLEDVVEELIDNSCDPDLQTRAADLLAGFKWATNLCLEYDK